MIQFLRRIATEPDPPDAGSRWAASVRAINVLETFGQEGRAVIEELVAEGSIATGMAQWRVQQILERSPGGGAR